MYLSYQTLMVITLKRLKKKVNQYRRLVYSTLSILFFLGNYHLLQFFYPLDDDESIRNWWLLKVDVYVLVICLCYLSMSVKGATDRTINKIEMFMYSFGVGLAVSNFIDRRFLHDREFGLNDLGIIIIIALVSQIDLKKMKDKAINQFKNI